MKRIFGAWAFLASGLVALFAGDYYVRRRDGWLGATGTPTSDTVWFGVPIVLGLIAAAILWRGLSGRRSLAVRLVIWALHLAVGFVLYVLACLWYVIETGIDSP